MTTSSKKYIIQTWTQNPILRSNSVEIIEVTPDLREFCNDMIKLMRKNKWVGLAAPQVGKNIRLITTTQRDQKNWKDKFLGETIMINPVITEKSSDFIIFEEACISLPDILGKVKRHKSITVEFMDLKRNKQKRKLKDFNAVIIQHEIDHLDGVLFTDKLVKNKTTKQI